MKKEAVVILGIAGLLSVFVNSCSTSRHCFNEACYREQDKKVDAFAQGEEVHWNGGHDSRDEEGESSGRKPASLYREPREIRK